MIKKLPSWVEFGAFSLAFNAGIINMVALLGFTHQAVSHITGSVSALGAEMVQGHLNNTIHLILVIISFLIGATLSGLVTQDATLKLGRRYGVALIIETCLLVLALVFLLQYSAVTTLYLVSCSGNYPGFSTTL
ncbi:MAG: YoaK family protein [Alishewanella aestuarii]